MLRSTTIPSGGEPLAFAAGLRVDSAGNLFALVQRSSGDSASATTLSGVMEFGPTASGAATPITNFWVTSPEYLVGEFAID